MAEEEGPDFPVKVFIINKKSDYEKVLRESGKDMFKEEVDGLMENIRSEYENILARRRQIEGFGPLYMQHTKFAPLLDEAFASYQLGLFHATIAICGTITEKICYDFIDMFDFYLFTIKMPENAKHKFYEISFRHLLDFLTELGAIQSEDNKKLHEIYDIRNTYIHLKKAGQPEQDAIKVLNSISTVLESVFSVHKFYDIIDGKLVLKSKYDRSKS